MARRKNAPESIRVKHGLSDRLRSLRTEFYGERGGPDLARTLEIPVRTWYNYENGVTVPAEIILRIVELTSVEPVWLLRGEGSKFRANVARPGGANPPGTLEGLDSSPITTLLRVALERLEKEERSTRDFRGGSSALARRELARLEGLLGPANVREPSARDEVQALREVELRDVDEGGSTEGRREFANFRVADDSMAPTVIEGALVSFAEPEPITEALNGELVVASIGGRAIVRWFHHCGRFILLRAENPTTSPVSILIELGGAEASSSFHRVIRVAPPD